jgi:hypothetical protein
MEQKLAHDLAAPTTIEGLYLVPATVELAEIEMVLPSKPGSDLRLARALDETRTMYDVIILDSPPNLGKLAECFDRFRLVHYPGSRGLVAAVGAGSFKCSSQERPLLQN